jgi:antitoxin VapB
MNTARLFINGRSQAVRLPKEYRFEGDEVFITKVGEMVILYPRRKGWDLLARGIERFTDDFISPLTRTSARACDPLPAGYHDLHRADPRAGSGGHGPAAS